MCVDASVSICGLDRSDEFVDEVLPDGEGRLLGVKHRTVVVDVCDRHREGGRGRLQNSQIVKMETFQLKVYTMWRRERDEK